MTIFAGLLLLAAAPQAERAVDVEEQWVPFTLTPANQIRFAIRIDGRAATAILDTGVTTSTIARRFATAAGIASRSGAGALTVSGRVASGWTAPHMLTIGASARRVAHLAVADLPATATGGDTIDLLIGTDVTAAYALDIDYEAGRFRLLPSGRLPFRGSTAPLRVGADWAFYRTELTIAGMHIDRIVVDTGDGTALSLARPTATSLSDLQPAMTTTLDFAIGGTRVVDLAILPEVRSGTLTLRNIETRIEPARGFAEATGMAGRIGSGLLRHYRVLLDPGAGRMVLAPGRHADRPPLRSTSGFLLAVRPDRLAVLHVMRGSPAEQAGWKAGDAICAVDDAPVAPGYPSSGRAGWPVAAAGRTVMLTDCTGVNRPVTLRHFY